MSSVSRLTSSEATLHSVCFYRLEPIDCILSIGRFFAFVAKKLSPSGAHASKEHQSAAILLATAHGQNLN